MNRFMRIPPTRERRVTRQRAELIQDMLTALRAAQAYLAHHKLDRSLAYRQVALTIEKAETLKRDGVH